MIIRRLLVVPALALVATSLPGCVAVAIPALAGGALFGSRIDGKDAGDSRRPVAASRPASVATDSSLVTPPFARAAQAPVPTVTVGTAATVALPPSPAPAPLVMPAPAPAPMVREPAAASVPAQAPARIIGPVAAPVQASAALPVSVAARPAVVAPPAPPPAAYPDPSRPLTAEQAGFARFVCYGQASARGAGGGADLLSAMLSDPIALDGQRRRCAAGEQAVALIDLDPKDGVFAPPTNPAKQPGLALGLAVLRQAGVEIAWLSDLSVNQSGTVRTALEQSGLDPRGEDIISLRRDGEDSKQQRKDNLAGITCIVAIAGDERADFDERFKYLRNPEAGSGLEPVIGNGWFLIESVFPVEGGRGE